MGFMPTTYLNHFNLIQEIEPDLRIFLPARHYTDLYTADWADQKTPPLGKQDPEKEDGKKLKPAFDHLVTLQKILSDYTSSLIYEKKKSNPISSLTKRNGALMFTDLASFTKIMEANASLGQEGAKNLLGILNQYFTDMNEIISRAGGELLEFSGDALLVWFPDIVLIKIEEDNNKNNLNKTIAKAIRAGLRMQRAMKKYDSISTPHGHIQLKMRIGIHAGYFYSTDIGTPRRRDHILLGSNVQKAKIAESYGENGMVNLSPETYSWVKNDFHFNYNQKATGYMLVVDDLDTVKLGSYEITANPRARRLASTILDDKGFSGVYGQIKGLLKSVKHLASFIPSPVLSILLENVARREIPPDFPSPTMIFLNLVGLPNIVDLIQPDEEHHLIQSLSVMFSNINAIVEALGGLLKKVASHTTGSYMIICFGVPASYTDNTKRAAKAALEIRQYLETFRLPPVTGVINTSISCQIGMTSGMIFAAEVGGRRGRREFNFHSDTVNTAARLMDHANLNSILISKSVQETLYQSYECKSLGEVSLKGKKPIEIFELLSETPHISIS